MKWFREVLFEPEEDYFHLPAEPCMCRRPPSPQGPSGWLGKPALFPPWFYIASTLLGDALDLGCRLNPQEPPGQARILKVNPSSQLGAGFSAPGRSRGTFSL